MADTIDSMPRPLVVSAPTARILADRRLTIPSHVIITLTQIAVNGHASTAIANDLTDSAGLAFTAACTAPTAQMSMFTNPITEPILFAAVIATFHSAYDTDPAVDENAPTIMPCNALPIGSSIHGNSFCSTASTTSPTTASQQRKNEKRKGPAPTAGRARKKGNGPRGQNRACVDANLTIAMAEPSSIMPSAIHTNTMPLYCCIVLLWIALDTTQENAAMIHAAVATKMPKAHRPPTMFDTRLMNGKNVQFGDTENPDRSLSVNASTISDAVAAIG